MSCKINKKDFFSSLLSFDDETLRQFPHRSIKPFTLSHSHALFSSIFHPLLLCLYICLSTKSFPSFSFCIPLSFLITNSFFFISFSHSSQPFHYIISLCYSSQQTRFLSLLSSCLHQTINSFSFSFSAFLLSLLSISLSAFLFFLNSKCILFYFTLSLHSTFLCLSLILSTSLSTKLFFLYPFPHCCFFSNSNFHFPSHC